MSNKETLIKLAQDKGFKSQIFTDTEWLYSSKEDLRYYLWMCEFRRWLYTTRSIIISIYPNTYSMEEGLIYILPSLKT